VIFVTVGSDVPFSRLVRHVDLWSSRHPEEEVLAQVGRLQPTDYMPRSMKWTGMVAADQFDRHCAEARLIVAHAGMGSIISALASRTPIVVLPRSARLRETRNDHQFATAERIADRAGIFVAWGEDELEEVISRALASTDHGSLPLLAESAAPEFTDRLRNFILQRG
jgi:UDP-N-acetylglucosamine transferase subunit ALG13